LLEKAAESGNPRTLQFPKTRFPDSLDFSFSGLKTAALNQLNRLKQQAAGTPQDGSDSLEPDWTRLVSLADFAASYQQAIVDVLVEHTMRAANQTGLNRIAVAGGVSANRCLREGLSQAAAAQGMAFLCPPFEFCTDNAAMIASAGYFAYRNGRRDAYDLNAVASLELD
jgi:N6-L-threonylcarbamoyladenine synthase